MTEEADLVVAQCEVVIVNKRGLHARASAKLVAAVAAMDHCEVRIAKDGASADGAAILDLMMLGAAKGDTIEVSVNGEDAEMRLAEIVAMIEDGFGED